MKIFLTGGTGFIGKHFLKHATSAGYHISAQTRLKDINKTSTIPEVSWVRKPMDKLSTNDLAGHDVLVHLASPGVSPKPASAKDLIYWNVEVLMQLLELSLKSGIKRAVLAGTSAEYGKSSESYEFIPITAPLQPTSNYAASKAAGFLMANTFAMQNKIEICYLRLFSVFGEGQYEKNFWPSLMNAAKLGHDFPMTYGEQIRDYIHVSEVCKILLDACLSKEVARGSALVKNVGSGRPISMREFAQFWWKDSKAKGKILYGAIPYRDNECMRFIPEL